jgi:hypothetical protein
MVIQGLIFGFVAKAPQLVSWAKGRVLVGLLFYQAKSKKLWVHSIAA